MEHPPCNAIKADGHVCGKRSRAGQTRCGTHLNQIQHLGQAEVEARAERNARRAGGADQLRYHRIVFMMVSDAMQETVGYTMPLQEPLPKRVVVLARVPQPFHDYLTVLFLRVNALINDVYDWVGRAERMAGEQRTILTAAQAIVNDIRRHAPLAAGRTREINGDQVIIHRPAPPPLGDLARFAEDNQNVHTEVAVKQTKDIIDRVLKISVPGEYSYKKGRRTLGEILIHVPMSDKAAEWFTRKYFNHVSIYGYPAGIFSRVTDSVWQYTIKSPNKEDICKAMAVELEDNVGMCEQGNLTRICNVLAGYMEGINTESVGEQLQRRMALLMGIDSEDERVSQGKKILVELAVPEAEWHAWLEALA